VAARLAVVCPVTSKKKGYTFEVEVPPGLGMSGVVLADQIKSVDWEARRAALMCVMPSAFVDLVKLMVNRLI
jgi:mRNA interferase MazF